MKKIYLKIFLMVLLSFNNYFAQNSEDKSWTDNLSLNLITESDLSYQFSRRRMQKTELVFKPSFSYRFGRNTKLIGLGRIDNEFLDNLEPGKPQQEASSSISKRYFAGNITELELRELYLHTRLFDKLSLIIGKQQIVWGETDGLKLLDVVNPQYFREFILDEFEDSRIPLWSVKAEFPIDELAVQLVWIPDQTYNVIPGFDSPYFPGSLIPEAPPGLQTKLNLAKKPDRFFADADYGIRLSAFLSGWDITANYLYSYDDFAVLYTDLKLLPTGEPVVEINPEYKRNHLVGLTFNKTFGSFTFRSELAYSFNKYFTSTSENAVRGVVNSDQLLSAFGVDWISGETIISGQIFFDYLIIDVPAFNRDRLETSFSLLASQEFMNDTWKAEILFVQNLNRWDGIIRPKLSYWWQSNVELFLSSDIFYGTKSGMFGQFNNRSRITTGFSWGI